MRELDDARLGAALADLGREVRFPQLADVRPEVLRRIAEPRRARRWSWPSPARAGFVVAAVVVLLAALLAVSPAARAFAEEVLRLPGVLIFRGGVPTPTASALPSLSLGERVSLEEARGRAGYALVVPADPLLGDPDEVYVRVDGPVTQVSFVYRTRAGIPVSPQAGVAALVSEFDDATVPEGFFAKAVGPDARVTPVSVNGGRGFWLEGRPHAFFYTRREGASVVSESLRLAGNTLLWEQSGLVVRIEAEVDEATALRIAASVR